MEMNPQRVRSAEFKTVRKGADVDEVRSFLSDVADELERAQNQSTAMEARARAAVARLQELSDGQSAAASPADEPIELQVDQSETISRTLLLAQRTADSLIAEARAEATRVVASANDEAANTRDSTRLMAVTMLDEAREEARRSGEAERMAIASEVDSLKARRDFLESDVDHLEQFLVAQRSRLRDAATDIIEVTDRVPAGLGDVRRPLLSASDDDAGNDNLDSTQAIDFVIVTDVADPDPDPDPDPDVGDQDRDAIVDGDVKTSSDATPVEQRGVDLSSGNLPSGNLASGNPDPGDDDFRFSFDDNR